MKIRFPDPNLSYPSPLWTFPPWRPPGGNGLHLAQQALKLMLSSMVLPIHTFPRLLLLALLLASTPLRAADPPSDAEVWDFVVYLYGYDEEERAQLETLPEASKAMYIREMRNFEIAIKKPEEFNPEERKRLEALRLHFRDQKQLQRALAIGDQLSPEQLEAIVALSRDLLKHYAETAIAPREIIQYIRGDPHRPIPPGWEFCNPLKIRVRDTQVEVQLYVNAYRPNGPQVILDIFPEEDGKLYRLKYSTNVSVGKSWRLAAPVAKKQASHGPR